MPHRPQQILTAIVELRQYTLHAGARDQLITLFDREFVETQEACGMSVIGQFRDLDRDDRFVWLRGFAGMERRRQALERFYDGPVWARHRDEANATMIDFDDVHLLRPVDAGGLRELDPEQRLPGGAAVPGRDIDILIVPVRQELAETAARQFAEQWLPRLIAEGASSIAILVTEPSENSFARLPVRTDSVLVWIGRLNAAAGGEAIRGIAGPAGSPEIEGTEGPARHLRLRPTSRSLLR